MLTLDRLQEFDRPKYYHRDGSPIIDNELFPASTQWALLFEQDRTVGNTRTLYGERLSTVWLGMDHNWGSGKPLVFETMLFAPKSEDHKQREHSRLRAVAAACNRALSSGEELEFPEDETLEQYETWVKKHYPHDQLQMRYTTENEASDMHETLTLQCLIPPRWRHFLLWTIARQGAWRNWNDDDDTEEL